METERKIEKWLRAYAKRRRAQVDAEFKLHPATRRMLQNEIASNADKTGNDDDSVSLWELIRQQWAFLLSFAICIFLLGVILLPIVYPPRKEAMAINSLGKSAQPSASAKLPIAKEDEISSKNLAEQTNNMTVMAAAPSSSPSPSARGPLPQAVTSAGGRSVSTMPTAQPPPQTPLL